MNTRKWLCAGLAMLLCACGSPAETAGSTSEGTPAANVQAPVEETESAQVRAEDVLCVTQNHVAVLHEDGTVTVTGPNKNGMCDTQDWKNVVQIAMNNTATVGATEDGHILVAGEIEDGDLRYVSNVEQVELGQEFMAVLTKDGKVYVGGYVDDGVGETHDWEGVSRIYVYGNRVFGLKTDGTVLAAGMNGHGELDVQDWTDIQQLSVGVATAGLKSDGTVVVAGGTFEYGSEITWDTSDWTDIVALSGNVSHLVGLRADGTVVATGENVYGECDTADMQNIASISTSMNMTVGVTEDGQAIWKGALVQGDPKTYYRTQGMDDWRTVRAVALQTGSCQAVAILNNGTLRAVGNNDVQQIEVADVRNAKIPGSVRPQSIKGPKVVDFDLGLSLDEGIKERAEFVSEQKDNDNMQKLRDAGIATADAYPGAVLDYTQPDGYILYFYYDNVLEEENVFDAGLYGKGNIIGEDRRLEEEEFNAACKERFRFDVDAGTVEPVDLNDDGIVDDYEMHIEALIYSWDKDERHISGIRCYRIK